MNTASQIAFADSSPCPAFDSPIGPPKIERRADARVLTILRVARASTADDTGLCRVQNISDEGMMVFTGLALAEGHRIDVALSETVRVSGQVSWTVGARAGIRFDERIDCAAMLQSLAAERSSADHRPTRIPADAVGVATTAAGVQAVRLVDISQLGMKIRHKGGLAIGNTVTVMLENGLQRRGIVRWSEGGLAGLRLLEPIAYRQLESAGSL